MCAFHGYRMKRYGTPEPTDTEILLIRLAGRIDKDVEAPCWRWTGHARVTPIGLVYGLYNNRKAHRVVYEVHVRPIPAGLQIDHVCRNTLCVNPEHLEPVTAQENLRRAWTAATPSPSAPAYPNAHAALPLRPDFRSFEPRFWKRVERGLPEGCWAWIGATVNGYGRFNMIRDRVYAHRYAYELLVGPIPPGAVVDHLCRNKGCVNPAHLEPVAQRENTRRALSR